MSAVGSVLGLVGCAYQAPLDPNAAQILGSITGELIYAGAGPVDAPAYAILFRADAPAPPDGTGGPVTFAAISRTAWSQEGGMQSAPYALTRLTPGAYELNALLDVDRDFNPFSSALAGATCGDWGGAHLGDLVQQQWASVDVTPGHLSDDISVLIGQPFPIERPSFVLDGTTLSLGAVAGGTQPPLFRVRSTSVATAFSKDVTLSLGPNCAPLPDPPAPYPACSAQPACACDPDTLAPCGTSVFLHVVDADLDGVPDPNPDPTLAAEGILDIWPRVYLEYIGAPLSTFEYDGRVLPERWVGQAFPLLGEVATVVATAGVDLPTAFGLLGVPVGTPFPSYEMSVTFVPVFVHYHADGVFLDANGPFDVVRVDAETPSGTVPVGAWAVTLIAPTGQTWTVPNDIGLLGLPSLDQAFDPLTQGAVLSVLE